MFIASYAEEESFYRHDGVNQDHESLGGVTTLFIMIDNE